MLRSFEKNGCQTLDNGQPTLPRKDNGQPINPRKDNGQPTQPRKDNDQPTQPRKDNGQLSSPERIMVSTPAVLLIRVCRIHMISLDLDLDPDLDSYKKMGWIRNPDPTKTVIN